MTSKEPIEKRLEKLAQAIAPDETLIENVMSRINTKSIGESERIEKLSTKLIERRFIMNRFTKLAAAAVVIIAVIIGVNHFGIDGATVAWANVTARVAQIDFVHFYTLVCDDNGFEGSYEGWYAHGKAVRRGDSGYVYYDDGQTVQGFDRHKTQTIKRRSPLASGQNFFEIMSRGLLSTDNEQFNQQRPINVGDDFLIYNFDPPEEDRNWIERISVTVGKNSLLPIQIKTYKKPLSGRGDIEKGGYTLVIFDYEAQGKPAEFFKPPTVSDSPHGKGKVVLDGEEVIIDIHGAPGIKAAVIRLHNKYEGSSAAIPLPLRERYEMDGGPVFSLDVAFITVEDFRSITNNNIIVWLNEGMKCGVGADNWPDGKYRNIRFTPVLRPTDQENTYIIEISCWLRTE